MRYKILILFILLVNFVFATQKVSTGSTDWGTASTWSPSGIPAASDTVTIVAGHTVTNGSNRSCGPLTINGTLSFTTSRTITVTGGVSVVGNIAGTGGVITSTGNLYLNSNVTNTTVAITLQTTAGLSITGTGTIPTLTINTTTTNSGNITVSTSLAGSNTLTNNGTLVIKGTSGITTLTATYSGNTVEYGGTGQTVKGTTYHHLTLSNSGIKTLGAVTTINGDLTMSGSAQLDVSASNFSLTIKGNWVNNSSNATPFNARSGTVTIGGSTTGTFTLSGTSTTAFNRISMNKGTDFTNYVFDIQSPFTMLTDGLRILNGAIKFSNTSSSFIPFNANISTSPNFTIPKTGGFWLNGSTVNYAVLIGMDWYVAGMLRVSNGTLNMGTNTSDGENVVAIDSSAVFKLEGGTINVSGRIGMYNTASYFQEFNISGGTLNLAIYSSTVAGRYCITSDRPSGTFTMSGGTIVFKKDCGSIASGYSDSLALKWGGSLSVSGGTIQLGDASTPVSQCFKINISGSIYNLTVASANATGILENNITIANDLTITSGKLDCNSRTLTISGNVVNDGVFTAGSGTVIFDGSSNKTISGSNSITFNNLTINKGSIANMTLNKGASVSGVLTLTNGNINTDATNYLTLTSTSTSTSGSVNSYINGPMVKQGSSDFVFPIGKNGKWMRLGITAPTTSSDFKAEYFNTQYSNIISKISTIKHVSKIGYWDLDRISGTGSTKVSLYWESASTEGINDCFYLTIGHFYSGQWIDEGPTTTTGSCLSGSGIIKTDNNITSFSPFTFASLSTSYNPLPITLVDFNLVKKSNGVEINWTTSNENNVSEFICEKSSDGQYYVSVDRLAPLNNGNTLKKYVTYDMNPYDGISYYRLVEIDLNGDKTYYNPASINIDKNNGFKLYPSITHVGRPIYFDTKENGVIYILDLTGRLIDIKTIDAGYKVELINNLPMGMYQIKFESENKNIVVTQKLLIQ